MADCFYLTTKQYIMKKQFKTIILFGLLCLSSCLFQRCNLSDFGDTNNNPNATSTPVTAALLTNALANLGRVHIAQGLYAQYFSESQYTDESRYRRREFGFGDYDGVLYDLENIIINNSEEDKKTAALPHGSHNNQIAVARILKVFFLSRVTDFLGDVPYFEALKGDPTPTYDLQEEIYRDFFKELDEAVQQFDRGNPATGDILFNGDITAWKKFANSYRLQLALRLSKVDSNLGKQQVLAALAADGGVMESQADNAVLMYPGGPYQSPFFWLYLNYRAWGLCDVFVNFLEERADPRLRVFGVPNENGEVIGIPYGVPREQAVAFINQHEDWSLILAPEWRQETSPFLVLSTADTYLARAEAAALGWTNEDAAELYGLGVRASMEWWEVYDPNTFEAYMAGPKVAIAGNDALEKIRFQRYLSFFPNGDFGWTIWRRTNVPELTPTPYAVNPGGQIPRRFVYWSREANLNPENYQVAVDRLGGDEMSGRVWWDK